MKSVRPAGLRLMWRWEGFAGGWMQSPAACMWHSLAMGHRREDLGKFLAAYFSSLP